MKRSSRPRRRRTRRLPWYLRFYKVYENHPQMCAVAFAIGGIVFVQAYFSTRFDKDECQRIMGTLVAFGVSALIGRRS